MPGQIKSAGAASAAGEVGPAPSQLPSPAGAVRDACQVCRVLARCLACFRPLGNLQRRVLTLPRPRKPSNNLFRPFRALENLQATCFGLSDASETFKQLVSAFPRRRKPSNNLFWPFRCVGNLQTTCLGLSDPSGRQGRLPSLPGTVFFEVPGQLPCPGRGRQGRLPSFPGTVFFEVPGQLPSPGRGRQGRLPSFPGTVFFGYPASLVDVPDAFGAAAPPSQGED